MVKVRFGQTVRRWSGLSALALVVGMMPAHADSLRAHYVVDLIGLHVGDVYADGSMSGQTYRVTLNAHLTGIAAMLSNVKMALASSGSVHRGALAPNAYATSAASSQDTRTLRMALASGNVKAVEIVPPPESHGPRVPVTEADKRNILDPTSAMFMTVPAHEPLVGPTACNRTLPIYDGYARFDIQLRYAGQREVSIPGYSGPVSVCSARYRPISGHLLESKSTRFMAENEQIEVWLAPVEHAHIVVPLRVSMPTMAGDLLVEATDFKTEAAGDVSAR